MNKLKNNTSWRNRSVKPVKVRVYCHRCVYIIMSEYLELKSKVADNERYTAKLMKERVQWSQTKETSSFGLQFNYLIPSMGKSIIV